MTDEQKAKFEALDNRMKGLVDDIECMREELYDILHPADDIHEITHDMSNYEKLCKEGEQSLINKNYFNADGSISEYGAQYYR